MNASKVPKTVRKAAAILLLLSVLISLVATPQILAQAPLPDLVVRFNQPVPSMARVGDLLQVDTTVVNQGTGPAGPFRKGLYFSTDATIDTTEVDDEDWAA